ncbi:MULTISPECIES: serine/threonine protein kinase, partial [Enorma]|uniref:serine/threonine protein kinase n=1 Tax=Enorma TaxID=1472762 RepID=UPI00036F9701
MASREHADEQDELARYLAALERDACYRVVRPLSPEGEAPSGPNAQPAATELVMFEGANGGELGPFVRKRLARAEGVGAAYETLFELQRAGMRFVHLPRIIDCYKTEDALVVVSEYVEGATLAALVSADGGGTAFARALFPEVCDAVSELHGLIDPPLIHRDVKPANIIISNRSDGVSATLIDFGIARRYRAGEGADTVRFGTRAYAPPEQFGFGQTSVRSDVYALGMVLLFCLTGTEPEGLPAADALTARGIEPALAEVVLKAAAFDPAARYASADALKQAFLAATDASREVEPAPRAQAAPASTQTPAAALTPRDTALAPNVPGATVDLPPAPVPRETPAPAQPRRPRAPWRTWLRNGA